MKLTPKAKDVDGSYWYKDRKGRVWSVVHLAALLPARMGVVYPFLGWEGLGVSVDDKLDMSATRRAESWEKLKPELDSYELSSA